MLSWSISTLLLTPWSRLCCELLVDGEMHSGAFLEVVGCTMYSVNLSVGGRSPKELIRPLRSSSFVERGNVCLWRDGSSFVASLLFATFRFDFLHADLSFMFG